MVWKTFLHFTESYLDVISKANPKVWINKETEFFLEMNYMRTLVVKIPFQHSVTLKHVIQFKILDESWNSISVQKSISNGKIIFK